MSDQTKIQLLPSEMELVSSPDIILTKNAILQKIKSFLEEIQSQQINILKNYADQLPPDILKVSPKISRGENYKGLPWMVLDNPRHFEHNNIFAIRNMFWWGNFFSITLHVSGRYKMFIQEKIFQKDLKSLNKDYLIYTGNDEWEHRIEQEVHKSLRAVDKKEFESIISKQAFLKITLRIPIAPLRTIEDKLIAGFKDVITLCI